MKAIYCSYSPITFGAAGPESPLASARYRAIIPFSTLTGVLPPLCYRTPKQLIANRDEITSDDLVIIGKNSGSAMLVCLKISQERGAKTIFDLCDNYFVYETEKPSIARCAKECSVMTVSTEPLAAIVRRQIGRDPLVIIDPYEGPEGAVRPFLQPDRLEMAIFCGAGNLKNSIAGLESIVRCKDRDGCHYAIAILSKFQDEHRDRLARLSAVRPDVTIEGRDWSREGVFAAIAASDIVLLPGSDDPISEVKSPNRLVEGLRGGRWVVAHPFPSYRPYGAWAGVTSDYSAAIAWARANPQEVQRRIQAGQAAIRAIHDPAIVGRSWLAAIQAAMAA